MHKFSKRWFGPYVVRDVHDNATYSLSELDGTEVKVPIAGKRIKVFKQRKDNALRDVEEEEYTGEIQSEDEALGSDNDESIKHLQQDRTSKDYMWHMPEDAQVQRGWMSCCGKYMVGMSTKRFTLGLFYPQEYITKCTYT